MGISKRYDRTVWTLFLMGILQSGNFSIMAPFLSVYLNTSLGASASMIGVLYMITGIVNLFSAPICGGLCDRWGRKNVLITSYLIILIGNVILAFVTVVKPEFYLFSFVYIMISMFRIWPMVAIDTVVSDVASSKGRLEVYGLMAAGGNAGFAVGSLIGGFFAASSALIFSLTAILSIPPLALSILLLKESKPYTADSKSDFLQFFSNAATVLRNRIAIAFLGILILMSLIWGQFYGLFPIYAEKFVGISSSEMGVSYALEGAVLAIFSYFVSRWATKLNLVTVYQIGVLFFSLAALGVGAMPSLVGIIVFYSVIEAFAEMFCGPSSKAIMAKLAPPDQRGTYLGVLSLFQREFTSFAPLVGGILMDILIPKFMLFWAIFFSLGLLGVILCFPLKKMAKKSLE